MIRKSLAGLLTAVALMFGVFIAAPAQATLTETPIIKQTVCWGEAWTFVVWYNRESSSGLVNTSAIKAQRDTGSRLINDIVMSSNRYSGFLHHPLSPTYNTGKVGLAGSGWQNWFPDQTVNLYITDANGAHTSCGPVPFSFT